MTTTAALAAPFVFCFISLAEAQGGYADRLWNAGPAAETLLAGTAPDWMKAPEIVKDRVGFIVFGTNFARKNLISQDDLNSCITNLARISPANVPVAAMVERCKEHALHDR